MTTKVNWLEENCNTLDGYFGLIPENDYRNDRNLAIRELGKPVVFIVQTELNNQVKYKYVGFDSLGESFDVVVKDMVGNAYPQLTTEDSFYLLEKGCTIKGILFQGRVVKFLPVTSHVAVLTPGIDSTDTKFDTLAGLIPYINVEVITNECQESEILEETSDRGDDAERRIENQQTGPEYDPDSKGTPT